MSGDKMFGGKMSGGKMSGGNTKAIKVKKRDGSAKKVVTSVQTKSNSLVVSTKTGQVKKFRKKSPGNSNR